MKNDARFGYPVVLAAVMLATLLLTGCGNKGPRFFEYDSDAGEVSGKINLDRITYVVPRLKVGADEGRLNKKNIDKLIQKMKENDYQSLRVKAYIIFDQHSVTMYESDLFEQGKHEPDDRELRDMKKQLKAALAFYQSI